MGGRAGGGASGGMGSRSRGGGYSSGIGSGKSYGLNKYERFTFEAIKSDASTGPLMGQSSTGQLLFDVAGHTFTESGLAKFIKSEFKAQSAKTGQSSQSMAKQITKNLYNIKTGDYFGNMADNI